MTVPDPTGPPVVLEFDHSRQGGAVAVIALNRPRLNMFDIAMRDAFIEAVLAVRDTPGVGALLLRANGPHFSAGADLSEFGAKEDILARRRIRWARDPWGPLWDLPVPSVVALHGHAVGAGLEMALLCDIRLAAPDTRLGLPETKLGMLPAAGGTQSLLRAAGPSRALPLVMTARTVTAAEAVERRIVHGVCEDVETEAMQTARQLALMPASVSDAARRALHAAADLPLAEGLALERRLHQVLAAERPSERAVAP